MNRAKLACNLKIAARAFLAWPKSSQRSIEKLKLGSSFSLSQANSFFIIKKSNKYAATVTQLLSGYLPEAAYNTSYISTCHTSRLVWLVKPHGPVWLEPSSKKEAWLNRAASQAMGLPYQPTGLTSLYHPN